MTAATLESRKNRTALLALAGAAAMLGLGYAAVPLYQLFCQVTGFAGTTQRATESDAAIAERFAKASGGQEMSIRFDGNVPELVAFLAEIEDGAHIRAMRMREGQIGCDRCLAIFRNQQFRRRNMDLVGEDFGNDGERVNARVKHPQPAGLPDPGLARMPFSNMEYIGWLY